MPGSKGHRNKIMELKGKRFGERGIGYLNESPDFLSVGLLALPLRQLACSSADRGIRLPGSVVQPEQASRDQLPSEVLFCHQVKQSI